VSTTIAAEVQIENYRPPTLILALLAALGFVANNIYLPSIPAMADSLATTAAGVQTTLTVYLVTFSFAQLILGPVSDYYGRRPVLTAGLALYTVASLACVMSGSVEQLSFARVFQALGACGAAVVGRALVRDVFSGLEMFRVMALISFFVSFIPGAMPALGGVMQDHFGWRSVFAFVVLVGALLWLWATIRFRETLRERSESLSLARALRAYRVLTARREYLWPAVLAGLPSTGLFAYFAGGPIVFIDMLGLTPSQFGLLAVVAVIGVMAGALTARYLPGRTSPIALLAIGVLFLLVGGSGMLMLSITDSMTVVNITSALILYLFGMGVLLPTGSSMSLQYVEAAEAGSASALTAFIQMLGASAGTLFVSLLGPWPALGFPLVMAGVGALGAMVWIATRGAVRHALVRT
jgi:DHA1 family bicyclomycin/chloramphenicol resistance-like MFS transporter